MSGFLSHSLSFLAPRHLSPPTTPSLASAASLLPRASAPLLMSHPQLGCLPFPASLAVSPGTSFLQPSSPACLLASSLPLSLSQAAQLLLLLLLLPSVALLLLLLQPPGGARRPKRTAAEKQAGTMAGSAALLLLPRVALALALAGASQSPPPQSPDDDPFAAQLGDISACRLRCTQSLPSPGTAAKNAVFNACYRGCRLFSICHFVDPTAELNATRAECESACMEAYTGGEERFGCTTGCRTQFPDVESRGEKIPDQKPASFSVFDLVSNFCNDIVSSAQSFISSTWTFYLQADDGKVVVFQSQPEIEYPIPEVQAPKSEVSEKAWTVSSPNTLKPHTGLREKLEKPPVEEPKSRAKMQPPVETQPPPEHDFLGCMSNQFEASTAPMSSHNLAISLWRGASGCYRRSGLPRWILAACLFLSIMVMLWLSCASLVTAPDQHIKTQPLSINGDKEYLDDLDGPTPYSLRPVIAVTICPADENEEAGLLPVKVDLDKTTL